MSEALKDQLRKLVTGNGDFTANEVNGYRKAVLSLHKQTNARKLYESPIPPALLPPDLEELEWTDAPAPFQNFQVKMYDGAKYLLGFRGVMSSFVRESLAKVAPGDETFQQGLREL